MLNLYRHSVQHLRYHLYLMYLKSGYLSLNLLSVLNLKYLMNLKFHLYLRLSLILIHRHYH